MNFVDLIDNIKAATAELAEANKVQYALITPAMAGWLIGQEQRPCVEVMQEFMQKFNTDPDETGKLFARWFLREVA